MMSSRRVDRCCPSSGIMPCVRSYVLLLAYLRLPLTFVLCSFAFFPHKFPAFHHKLPSRFPLFFPYNRPVFLFVFFYLSRVFSFVSSVLCSQCLPLVTRRLSCTFAVCSFAFPVSSKIRFIVHSFIPGGLSFIYLTHTFRFVFRELRLVFRCVSLYSTFALHHLPDNFSYQFAVRFLAFLVCTSMWSPSVLEPFRFTMGSQWIRSHSRAVVICSFAFPVSFRPAFPVHDTIWSPCVSP